MNAEDERRGEAARAELLENATRDACGQRTAQPQGPLGARG